MNRTKWTGRRSETARIVHDTDSSVERPTPLLPISPVAFGPVQPALFVMNGIDAGRVIGLADSDVVLGSGPDADVRIDETGVSHRHVRMRADARGTCVAEDMGSTNGTLVDGVKVDRATLHDDDTIELGRSVLRFERVDAATLGLRTQLYESSVHDTLTRLYNRRYFASRLEREFARVQRSGAELALLMLDVDHFKRFNDSFGHLPGDRALAFLAARLLGVARTEDVVARWGGEEFVVLARDTTLADATEFAERIRHMIYAMDLSVAQTVVALSVSIGVASASELRPDDEPAALVALSDERMYAAKLVGRNRVVACG